MVVISTFFLYVFYIFSTSPDMVIQLVGSKKSTFGEANPKGQHYGNGLASLAITKPRAFVGNGGRLFTCAIYWMDWISRLITSDYYYQTIFVGYDDNRLDWIGLDDSLCWMIWMDGLDYCYLLLLDGMRFQHGHLPNLAHSVSSNVAFNGKSTIESLMIFPAN